MIGGLIVTHGRLAIELLNAAEMIVGEIHHVAAVSLGWHDDVDTAASMIQKALERVQTPEGVLILTDMFGGTPTNIASTLLDEGKVEIVTGVNLPMLIKLAQMEPGQSLTTVARLVRDTGQKSIYIASELLAPKDAEGKP
jgi:mannose PTS system EIIA component